MTSVSVFVWVEFHVRRKAGCLIKVKKKIYSVSACGSLAFGSPEL